jgi:tRNA threonylcarbamoyladenosine biosynthesis protein TsaE
MVTSISHSTAETEALGENWGRSAEPGLVIGLCGELGAGKTQLVKGLARGLGITARVHSPTFALINVYPGGRMQLFHLDLYRLDTPQQIIDAGLEEYFHQKGVTVIEWADKAQGLIPNSQSPSPSVRRPRSGDGNLQSPTQSAGCLRWVQIEVMSPTERRISYEDTCA